jgi:hypothetical protein
MMNTRYTYHIRGVAENAWADQWYIGSRTSTHGRTPEEDIGIHYFTSSTNDDFVAQFKAHPEWFVCTILERGYVSDVVMKDDEDRRITESWNVLGRINRTNNVILFERDEAFKANQAAANRKKAQDPVWKAKNAAANRKLAQDPVWKANHAAGARKRSQDPKWRANTTAASRKNAQDPVWKVNHAAAMRKKALDPKWRANTTAAARRKAQDPKWRANTTAGARKRSQDPVWKANHAAAMRKKALDPEFVKKISDGKKRARALREAASSTVSC